MNAREKQIVKEALLSQQGIYLRILALAEPQEMDDLNERIEACAKGIEEMSR